MLIGSLRDQERNLVEDPRICSACPNRSLTSQRNRLLADSFIVKRDLLALIVSTDDAYTLADLGRAIAYAQRKDNLPVWRAFVRTRGDQFAKRETTTQRIRVRYAREVVARRMADLRVG